MIIKKISIILPTYNGEKFICDAIESILNQTYPNWELIIVNDCSCDNTLNIITKYAKKDSRIKVITNAINKKLPASLNVGFKEACGDYYTWTSDDNILKPNALSTMAEFLNSNLDVDLVSCDFDFINEDCSYYSTFSKMYPKRNMQLLAKHCNIGACFLYRKEIAKKVGEYNEETFCAEDYDYWCRVALNGKIAYIDDNLYQYRVNSQSLTATKKDIIEKRTNEVRQKYSALIYEKIGLSKEEQIKSCISNYYFQHKNHTWIKIASQINFKLCKKYLLTAQIKRFFKRIFSIENKKLHKIINILFIKISVKRKFS